MGKERRIEKGKGGKEKRGGREGKNEKSIEKGKGGEENRIYLLT